ncbi:MULTISPECIES: phosphopantetheine-binding protein, partial [Streptomyces]|uniref:phosphopantetheine-binding protein n=1 Tax=Streptomyces TaxID=1883 RepID=UPI0022488CC2
ARGRVAVSLAWGPWADGDTPHDAAPTPAAPAGPGAADEEAGLRRRGLTPMAAQPALDCLARAVAGDAATLTVCAVDWDRFATAFTALRPSPLLADVPEVARRAARAQAEQAEDADASTALRERLGALGEAGREAGLVALVREQAAAVLGLASAEDVEREQAFRELGFDSLMAVELRNRLTRHTGLPLPAGFVFDYPNAVAAAGLLRRRLFQDAAASGEGLLRELDRLEASLGTAEPDALTRTRVAVRLQAFLTKWQGEEQERAADDGGVLGTLGSASDDELLSFIDREMGR